MFLLYPYSSGILLYARWYCMLRTYLFKLLGRSEIKRINFLSNPVEFYFHVDFFSFPSAFLLIKVNWDSAGGKGLQTLLVIHVIYIVFCILLKLSLILLKL